MMAGIPMDKLKLKKRYDSLLSPGRIGSMQLRNRIVMTAMGSNLCNPDGTLNERIKAYYEARARGGAAMVIMGSVSIAWPIGSANACQVAISDDRYIEGFADIARRIHGHGAKIALQLQHAGVTAMNDIADGRPLLVPSVPKEGQSDIGPMVTENEQSTSSLTLIPSLIVCSFFVGARRRYADSALGSSKRPSSTSGRRFVGSTHLRPTSAGRSVS